MLSEDGDEFTQAVKPADDQLYLAKREGKNTCIIPDERPRLGRFRRLIGALLTGSVVSCSS